MGRNELMIFQAHIDSVEVLTGDDDSVMTESVVYRAGPDYSLAGGGKRDVRGLNLNAPGRLRGEPAARILVKTEGVEEWEEPDLEVVVSHHKGTVYVTLENRLDSEFKRDIPAVRVTL